MSPRNALSPLRWLSRRSTNASRRRRALTPPQGHWLESRCMLSHAALPTDDLPVEVSLDFSEMDWDWRQIVVGDPSDPGNPVRDRFELGMGEAPDFGEWPADVVPGDGSLDQWLDDRGWQHRPKIDLGINIGGGQGLPGPPNVDSSDGNWSLGPPLIDTPIDGELGGFIDFAAPTTESDATSPLVGPVDEQETRQVQGVLGTVQYAPADLATVATTSAAVAAHLATPNVLPELDGEDPLPDTLTPPVDDNGGMIVMEVAVLPQTEVAPPELGDTMDEAPLEVDSAYGQFQAFEISTAEAPLSSSDAFALGSVYDESAPSVVDPEVASPEPSDADPSDAEPVARPPDAPQPHGARAPTLAPSVAERTTAAREGDKSTESTSDPREAAKVVGQLAPSQSEATAAIVASVVLAARGARSSTEKPQSRRWLRWLRRRSVS